MEIKTLDYIRLMKRIRGSNRKFFEKNVQRDKLSSCEKNINKFIFLFAGIIHKRKKYVCTYNIQSDGFYIDWMLSECWNKRGNIKKFYNSFQAKQKCTIINFDWSTFQTD